MAGLLGNPKGIGGLLGGYFDEAGTRFNDMRTNNPEALLALSAGLLAGKPAEGLKGMAQTTQDYRQDMRRAEMQKEAMAQDQARFAQTFGLQQQEFGLRKASLESEAQKTRLLQSQTAKFLEAQGAPPELVQMAQAGGGAEAFKYWAKANGGAGGELGLVPIYGQDENGNTVVMQPSKEGGLFRANVPEGVTPLSPRELNSERAYGTKAGGAQADQTISAPGAAQAADNALGLIKSIREDPSLDMGVGGTSVFNGIPGTSGRGFAAKVDQAKGGAFLTAIQQMQGLGALSNNEGAAATSAVTRMDTALSKEDFLAALADYEKIVSQAKVKAENLMGGRASEAPGIRGATGGSRTSSGIGWSIEP